MRAWRRTKSIDGRQVLGVALAAGRVRRGEHALVAADGAADLLGGGGDPEDEHQSCDRPRLEGLAEDRAAGRPAAADAAEREIAVVVVRRRR